MSSCHETKPHVAHAFVVPGSAGSLSTSAGGGSSEPSDGMAVTMQPRVFYLYHLVMTNIAMENPL